MKFPVPGLVIAGPRGKDTVTLDRALGGGAFGIVFQAKESDGTSYAVKFPQYAIFGGRPDLAAFFNEVQAASEVKHPNVVRVLHAEVSSPDAPPYLIMEYLPDGTLKARLDAVKAAGASIPVDMIREWAIALIDGMEAINAKMLHRDLKPDNILMAGDTPKIADFGLSKLVGAATRSNTFKGGQHMLYMAPEGWRVEKNDIQIDMYALGIVLYEIAALSYPYKLPADPRDVTGLQRMHFFELARPLRSVRPDLSASFCQAVAKLMEKRPQDRFGTWQQAREMVQKAFEWASPAAATQPVITSLVDAVGHLHDTYSRQQLEEDEQETAEREWKKLDEFQSRKLLDELHSAVDAFNQASPLVKIEFANRGNRHEFMVPFGGPLTVKFFTVSPPLKLKRGTVRYAALVSDLDGGGLNFLLCRTDGSELYGRWVPLRASPSALLDPRRIGPRAQPFGLEQGEMKHISLAESAMHIFNLDYPETSLGEAFLDAVRQTMARRQKKSK
jgi:serine/threonine protein kinase